MIDATWLSVKRTDERAVALMDTPVWRPKLGVYIACALSLACMAMFVWVVLR